MLESVFFYVDCQMHYAYWFIAEVTHSFFLMMSALSEIFMKSWYVIQEHIAPVWNKGMIGSHL